ncbi:class II glutamine amidotransferase [Legionella yabuuchiae]|uniref:class II glutamine amidotransferase n=1 Tax=Legionella yabuuchiae TaxID=376727 RepID=UPI001055D25A|nr:class II glutamine amidotransferase [Legionella yabuuchiae]
MCRLIAYLGHEVLLEDVLVKPVNSIIMQSLHARESEIPTNGDGFGVGWYNLAINSEPALFTSISPAWNDRNLLHLTAKIMSPAFFAHVRAASAGGVTQYNCHPFRKGKWMLMHNGGINQFIQVKRHIRHLLDDDIYHWIQGETDSEHLFALFQQLAKEKDITNLNIAADVLQEAYRIINELQEKYGEVGDSYYNVCLTDGKRLLASRFCTEKGAEPDSLHYAVGSRFEKRDDKYHVLQEHGEKKCALVASEKLNDFKTEWEDVPVNHFLLVEEDFSISTRPVNL